MLGNQAIGLSPGRASATTLRGPARVPDDRAVYAHRSFCATPLICFPPAACVLDEERIRALAAQFTRQGRPPTFDVVELAGPAYLELVDASQAAALEAAIDAGVDSVTFRVGVAAAAARKFTVATPQRGGLA